MTRNRQLRLAAVASLALTFPPALAAPLAAQPAPAAPAGQAAPQSAALKAQADEKNNEGKSLAQKQDFGGAAPRFREAVELYRRAGDGEGEAKAHANLGLSLWYLGERAPAVESYTRSAELHRARGNRGAEAVALVNIGSIYDELKDRRKTLEFYLRALPLLEAEGARDRVALILSGVAVAHDQLGEYPQAVAAELKARELFRQLGDKAKEAAALSHVAGMQALEGSYTSALDYFRQALALWEAVGDVARTARTHRLVGDLSDNLGRPNEALVSYNKARALWQAAGDKAEEAELLNAVGLFYQSLGDDRRALDQFRLALPLWRASGARFGEAMAHHYAASSLAALGDHSAALDSMEKALALWRDLKEAGEQANTLTQLAATYEQLGDPAKALASLESALDLWRAQKDRFGEVNTLVKLSAARAGRGERARALEHLALAAGLAGEVPQPHMKSPLLSRVGLEHLRLGEAGKALASFSEALALIETTGDRRESANAHANVGWAHEALGNHARALDSYMRAVELQESILNAARAEELKSRLAEKFFDVYERAVLLLVKLDRPSEAFDLSERARARSLLDQMSSARFDLREGADTRLVREEQSLRLHLRNLSRTRARAAARPAPQRDEELLRNLAAQIAERQREYGDLLVRIQLSNPRYADALGSRAPLTRAAAQSLLDPDTTLVSYFVTPDRVVAFVLTRDSFRAFSLPARESELAEQIARFGDFDRLESGHPPELQRLHAQLVEPLRAHLKTARVAVVPHGVLHFLPFGALTDGRRFFGEERALFYLPSASILQFIKPKAGAGGARLLALAQGAAEGGARLPNAVREAQAVARLYGAQPLTGAAATETALASRAGEFTILHVAAHGEFDTDNPLFSRILLAPDAASDGSLEAHEVYGLSLAKTDLVVLSGCQTQSALKRRGGVAASPGRGDNLVALNRAFIYAGSPSVIASLWKVDDEATADLMSAFYTHLRRGEGKAAALQAAQREMRAKRPHPFYWAAFVLTGDPGAAKTPQAAARVR